MCYHLSLVSALMTAFVTDDILAVMAESDRMPNIDNVKDKPLLDASTQALMKFVEKENLQRVDKLKKIRSRNLYTGFFLGVGVLSIYAYSIYSVKQETSFDDFEEPKVVQPTGKILLS